MVLLALLGQTQGEGQLEFFDVRRQETLAVQEHPLCTCVVWDPSGRYLITAVTQDLGNW